MPRGSYNSEKKLSPVVCLAIVDKELPAVGPAAADTKILVVVRDPATNQHHGDVVSVPTMRIPQSLLDSMWDGVYHDGQHGNTVFYRGAGASNLINDGHNPTIFTVEGIVGQKLGVSEHIERGMLSFQAVPFGQMVGTSVNDGRTKSREEIRMAGICVEIVKGAELFPPQTATYSHVTWVSVLDFMRAVATKDTGKVGLDPFRFCIYGLCIATTYDFFAKRLGMPPFCDMGVSTGEEFRA